jgi:hypothetical protein
VSGEKLGQAEGTDAIGTENLSHLFVGGEKLLVSGILEFVLLEVSPKFGTCKATWAMMWLSSCYEIAQVTLQGSTKDCIKVRILIFSVIFQHFFFVIKIIYQLFSNKKRIF